MMLLMLLLLLLLLLLLPQSLLLCPPDGQDRRDCLRCHRMFRDLEAELCAYANEPQIQTEVENILKEGYRRIEESGNIIGLTTLQKAVDEIKNEFDRIMNSNDDTESTLKVMKVMEVMEGSRTILKKHVSTNDLCPNQCGLLRRTLVDCNNCQNKVHECPSPTGQLDCGDQRVWAEEEGVALDCFREWHPLIRGRTQYHFSWAPGTPNSTQVTQLREIDFRLLSVTDESSLFLNQLREEEQGTYRCSLKSRGGTLFFQIRYLLTVLPLPTQTPRPLLTLPTMPPDPWLYTEAQLVPVIATVTVLCLVGSLGLMVVLGRRMMVMTQRQE